MGHPSIWLPGHPRAPSSPPETGLSRGRGWEGAVESAGPQDRRMLLPEQGGPATCLAGRGDDLVDVSSEVLGRFWGGPQGAVIGAFRCLERRGTGRKRGPHSSQGRGCLCANPRSTPHSSPWRGPQFSASPEDGSRPTLPPLAACWHHLQAGPGITRVSSSQSPQGQEGEERGVPILPGLWGTPFPPRTVGTVESHVCSVSDTSQAV